MMRSSSIVRVLALSGVTFGSLGSICNPVSIYACSTDDDCSSLGRDGRCESNLACSFPDAQCPTGRRWHRRADDVAGQCLDSGHAGSDGGSAGDDGSALETGSSGFSEPSTEDTGGDGTTAALESSDTGSPETGGVSSESTSSTTAASSETGMAPTCDELYGSALEYQRCSEEPTSCSFNVRVDMTASCNQVCGMFGRVCLTADLNESEICVSVGEVSCDDMSFVDGICTCTRT